MLDFTKTLMGAVAALALMAGTAIASPLPPGGATLAKGLKFDVADKTFTITDVLMGTTGTANIGTLTVIPDITTLPGGIVGIGFDITGSVSASGSGSVADVSVKYHVTVNDPTKLISDAHLFITGSASSDVGVSELLMNGAVPAGTLHVTGTSPVATLDPLLTGPVTDLDVTKGIFAIPTGGLVQWTDVGQLFTQVSVNTPEPLTLTLFGAGFAGAGALRRRRNK